LRESARRARPSRRGRTTRRASREPPPRAPSRREPLRATSTRRALIRSSWRARTSSSVPSSARVWSLNPSRPRKLMCSPPRGRVPDAHRWRAGAPR
jgi:hypothetical protein